MKLYVKVLAISIGLVSLSNTFHAQNVGINTSGSNADASSMLDVSATDKGILIPRVALTNVTNSATPVNSPAAGLLVYNTNAAVTGGSGVGFYFWSGSVWTKMATGNFGTTLTNGRVWVGDGSNAPVERQITGDISISNTGASTIQTDAVTSAKILNGDVSNADLATMPALTIKGNGTNGIAAPTDIAAGTDGHVLRRSGTTVGFGTLSNSSLANSSVTVSPGTGMSGGGTVALGGTITLTNAGVTSLAGTTNRVTVSGSTGAITLSGPQDIHTGANPTFNSVTVPNDFFGRINIEDTRATNAAPSTYAREVHFEFKTLAAIGAPGSGTYGGLMTMAPWSDNSGNNHHQLFFNDGGIYYRTGVPAGAWNSWTQLLTGNQISGTTNYVPKYTGANSLGNSQIYDNGTNVGIGNTNNIYKLDVSGALRTTGSTTVEGGLFTQGTASTLYGANASIYANNGNVAGGGIMISDDGGFADYNDAYVTYVGSTGLRIAGNSGNASSNGVLRINGLSGTGNRPIVADANGILRTTENSVWTLSANFASSPDDITGYTDLVADGQDDVLNVYNLGFNITIEGTVYNQISVNSNGWIAFGNIALPGSSWVNTGLPASFTTNPVIFPYWDDLKDFGSGEYIRAITLGTAPNRVGIVYFRMREQSATTGNIVHFQVMIHETSNLINVKYFDPMAPAMNGQSATVGFQLSGGNVAKAFPLGYNAKIFDDNRDDSEGWSVCPVR